MTRYRDLNGNSGVVGYEISPGAILVLFSQGRERSYLYTVSSAGSSNIREMQRLANAGCGLNSFINLNVKHNYERKW